MYKGRSRIIEGGEDASEYKDAYSNINKTNLVHDSKMFNEKKIRDSECINVINKAIYLLNQGQAFEDVDKSSFFFNVTKVFQMPAQNHVNLRRLVYVFIKELKVHESEVFIVISCLTKDIQNAENPIVKANALRVLTKIIDEQYVQSLEKFLKQALLDKSDHVVSAAIVSLIELYKKGGHALDLVKKSVNELQDKLQNSQDGFVKYQALLMLFELKKNDSMACLKLLYQLAQQQSSSTITRCQLIRYIKISLLTNAALDQRTAKTFVTYIESNLTKEEDVVQFEASKAMCELHEAFGSIIDVETAFQILIQLSQNSSKPVYKYAALRVMNRIATKQPRLIVLCQQELEQLITDSNRSVASLAISTLLKTCNEDSVQKLLKQISIYLPELGIEFKTEAIQSITLLYHRMPQKSAILLKFLHDCLKDDANQTFRESVVDTIMEICPSQRETALNILSEHIEDCEHAHIQTKILNFLAQEGPLATNPASYIRFIYNRVNLEKAVIRAAAISSLASFAHKCPNLKKSILLLMHKCLQDSDDEVRERALFYIGLLEENQEIVDPSTEEDDRDDIKDFIFDSDKLIDIDALENYVSQNRDALTANEDEFHIDLSSMMVSAKSNKQSANKKQEQSQSSKSQSQSASNQPSQQNTQSNQSQAQEQSSSNTIVTEADRFFEAMKQEESLQEVLDGATHIFSSQVSNLNDSNAEYVVSTVKHFFDNYIVVQYGIKNTIEDQVLSNVQLNISGVETEYNVTVQGVIPLAVGESIKNEQTKYVYAILNRSNCQQSYPIVNKIKQGLSFTITEIDVDTEEEQGSYDEDYALDDSCVAVRDYMKADLIPSGQFKQFWDGIGSHAKVSEVIQTFQIPFKAMEEAVSGVSGFFGMSVCEGSNNINVAEKAHNILMSGLFTNKEMVLVHGIIGFNQQYGCVLKVTIRSLNEQVSNTLLEAIN